eukprot:m.51064 g.51064  ORF g.51064 m.51064 type:complete len:507 (-) comp10927_c0_seq2:29-1549(-)
MLLETLDKIIGYIITYHRWVVVMVFLMPASLVMNTILYFQAWWALKAGKINKRSIEQHKNGVKKVVDAIEKWRKAADGTKLCTARPGWLAMSIRIGKYKDTHTGIPVGHLNSVVSIDKKKKTVFVEPNVTMGQITATLLPLGFTLPVLPELDALTVGGVVCGVGVETSSHKYGLFQHCCRRFEVALATGEVLTCSATENTDLFKSIPWSHGTLGFLVGVEIDIIPSKQYVNINYEPLHSREEFVEEFKKASESDNDFVECLAFAPDQYVLMTANFTDKPNGNKMNRIGLWYKPWFYTHVIKFLEIGSGSECIPIRDYFHRHTRSLFWEMRDIISFGNDLWFRVLFGWMMPPNASVLKRTQTPEISRLYELHHIVQDMLVPISKLHATLDKQDKEGCVYPLWLCPMRIFKEDAGFIHPTKDGEEMFVDVGIYGIPQVEFHPKKNLIALEKFVRDNEGFQMLYADMYQTEEEFREMFSHALYDRVREQYKCTECLPTVFDKTCKAARR